jgi:predicted dehydrogenase
VNYRFHPAIHRVKEILESKELGAIKNISVTMVLPALSFKDDDIRFDYSLGGGALMDLGCGCYFFQKVLRI